MKINFIRLIAKKTSTFASIYSFFSFRIERCGAMWCDAWIKSASYKCSVRSLCVFFMYCLWNDQVFKWLRLEWRHFRSKIQQTQRIINVSSIKMFELQFTSFYRCCQCKITWSWLRYSLFQHKIYMDLLIYFTLVITVVNNWPDKRAIKYMMSLKSICQFAWYNLEASARFSFTLWRKIASKIISLLYILLVSSCINWNVVILLICLRCSETKTFAWNEEARPLERFIHETSLLQ